MFLSRRAVKRTSGVFTRRASAAPSTAESGRNGYSTAGVLCLGGLVVGTAYLGTWQTRRYFWKVHLVERRKEKVLLPAALLAPRSETRSSPRSTAGGSAGVGVAERVSREDLMRAMVALRPGEDGKPLYAEEDEPKLANRKIAIEGEFIGRDVYLGPRSAPPSLVDQLAPGTSSTGYTVLRAFRLVQGGVVFVNRGWVPTEPRKSGPDLGKVAPASKGRNQSIEVVLMPEEVGGSSLVPKPANDVAGARFFWLEAAQLPEAAGVSDGIGRLDGERVVVVVEEVASSPAPAVGSSGVTSKSPPYVLPTWPTPKATSDFYNFHVPAWQHQMYAGTWFSLSAAGFIMTVLRFRR